MGTGSTGGGRRSWCPGCAGGGDRGQPYRPIARTVPGLPAVRQLSFAGARRGALCGAWPACDRPAFPSAVHAWTRHAGRSDPPGLPHSSEPGGLHPFIVPCAVRVAMACQSPTGEPVLWAFQGIESAIFALLAAALVAWTMRSVLARAA